jgi:hypothetical protein
LHHVENAVAGIPHIFESLVGLLTGELDHAHRWLVRGQGHETGDTHATAPGDLGDQRQYVFTRLQ